MQPLLPRLKKDTDSDKTSKLAEFKENGEWRVGTSAELSALSKSLEIDEFDLSYLEVDSIPDMWARPILFEMAFFNEHHLLHKRIVAEWRGLLTMLALKEIRHLPIDCAEVRIPKRAKPEELDKDKKAAVNESPDFLQALGDLAPEDFLTEDSDWHRLYVILFSGQPIGMTSPTTLVCTAVNYINRIRDVAWFDGRLLQSPVNPDDPTKSRLNEYEKNVLISWLEYVSKNLAECEITSKRASSRCSDLIKEIGKFQELLGKTGHVEPAEELRSPTGLNLRHGIFSFMDKPIKSGGGTTEGSYVKLKPSRMNPDPSPALLVIDKEIATQWRMRAQDVIVVGSTTLSSIPYSGLGKDRTRFADVTLVDAEWATPEMFFTQKLFYVAQKNAFPGSMEVEGMPNMILQGEPATPILPIQPWLLKYLSLQDLSNRFAFQKTNDGMMARLKLPLRGKSGEGEDFIIQKEYRNTESDLYALRQLPVVEVWPNFAAENWKAYYTYYSRNKGAKTFYASPVMPGTKLERQSDKAKAKLSEDGKFIECETHRAGPRLEQITRLEQFPEGFECFFDIPDTSTKKFNTIAAGLILLQQPAEKRQVNEWKIGIDFGTTGTNVYYSDGIVDPRPLEFHDLFWKVTDSVGDDRADTINYRFVAGKNAVAPFLSIYHDFEIADPAESRLRPLLDGHIFFKNIGDIFNAMDQSKHTNLKWGTSQEDRKRANAFLTQLCFQCAAEAVSQEAKAISWRYSFPTAFSSGDIVIFQQAWNSIVKICNQLTGIGVVTAGTDGAERIADPPKPKTESVASGQFFADKQDIKRVAPFGDKGACLDIGGGTSDISIWYNNQLRWQTSVRFAGRNMLLNLFYQNPVFIKRFEKSSEIDLVHELATKKQETRFYAQLDVLLKEKGRNWQENLYLVAGEDSVSGFMQLIAVSLAGLIYYVGQILGALHGDEKVKFPAEIPNVFVGGNGARMFDWLTGGGRFTVGSPISGLFKAMLIAGSGFKTKESDIAIYTSPEPKSEVAYGLVSDRTRLDGINQLATDGVIAGEDFSEGGKEKAWMKKLTEKLLHSGISRPPSLNHFKHFLETFKDYTKAPGNRGLIRPLEYDDFELNACAQNLAQELGSAKLMKEDEIHVEPLFITVLKHFLGIKITQWAEAQKPV